MPEEIEVKPEEEQITSDGGRLNPPVVDEAMTPPRWRENKWKILGGILGILVFAGAVFGVYKYVQRQVQPGPKPTPTPGLVATPTLDPTDGWETYTNKKVGFSFKYPQTLTTSECKDGLHLFESISGLKSSEFCETPPLGKISLEYSITSLSPGYSQSIEFEVKEEEIVLGNTKAIKQTIKKIKEAPGPDYAVFVIFSKDNDYFLVSLRDKQYEDTFNLILSTFKFLEEETPQQVSIPNDWQEFTATDPDFGIKTTLSLPPGYSFRFTGSEFTIQNDADATELWDYSTSVYRDDDGVLKNHYNGGSRRTWYQDYLSKKQINFEYKYKIINTSEIPLNGTSYLKFSVEIPAYDEHGIYSGTKIAYHYLYVQNNIVHIITPASEKATLASAQIPKYIDIIFFSLRSNLIK